MDNISEDNTEDNDGNGKGLAFIRFETKEGSDNGLSMDGFWYGDRKIFVEYARDNREKNK